MATTLDHVTTSTRIDADIEDVWQAITTPSRIKRWFFGVDTETDWQVGSPIVHRGEYHGKPYVDRGEILEFSPPRRLVHTHWSDVSGDPDAAEQHQVVSWELEDRADGTELTISETHLPSGEAARTSEQAWVAALDSLKEMLER